MTEHQHGDVENPYPKLWNKIKFKSNTELYTLLTASIDILADNQSTNILEGYHEWVVTWIIFLIMFRLYDGKET